MAVGLGALRGRFQRVERFGLGGGSGLEEFAVRLEGRGVVGIVAGDGEQRLQRKHHGAQLHRLTKRTMGQGTRENKTEAATKAFRRLNEPANHPPLPPLTL